jgi:ribose 5-phosphate isomerase A
LPPPSLRRRMALTPQDPPERGKEAAGARAAEAVRPGMTLGLGTGSTVEYFLAALGRRCQEGELPGVRGVPTSLRTEREASSRGIPLITLEEAGFLDLTVDGADEVDPGLDLIKGLGGALLREKMVAQASRRFVIIVDENKLVPRLGTRSPLPVEVVRFAWRCHLPFLESLGAEVDLKTGPDGEAYLTDNGNLILHCRFTEGIGDPAGLEDVLASRAGIVETGLFLGLAGEVLVGGAGTVRSVSRPR